MPSESIHSHGLQPRLHRLRSLNLSIKNTKHFLKASAEPILRAFRIPYSDFAEFPRGRPTILEWSKNLIAHYSSQDDLDASEVHRRRMNMLTVSELRWYKGVTGVEHEYVVAIISDPQCGSERFVRLDRVRDDPGADVPFPTANRRYASSSNTFSSSQSSLSIYDDPIDSNASLDLMWVLYELPEKDRLIERSTFRPSYGAPPTLLDLALVAKAVHENNNHFLWPRQCVWFCSTIVRVLQADFRHHITHRDSSLTFQNWMIEVMAEGIGTSKAKAIHKEQEQVTGDIIMAYRDSRMEVMARVSLPLQLIQMRQSLIVFRLRKPWNLYRNTRIVTRSSVERPSKEWRRPLDELSLPIRLTPLLGRPKLRLEQKRKVVLGRKRRRKHTTKHGSTPCRRGN